MCCGKTVPCGSVSVFVIQILINIPFVPYIYTIEMIRVMERRYNVVVYRYLSS